MGFEFIGSLGTSLGWKTTTLPVAVEEVKEVAVDDAQALAGVNVGPVFADFNAVSDQLDGNPYLRYVSTVQGRLCSIDSELPFYARQ